MEARKLHMFKYELNGTVYIDVFNDWKEFGVFLDTSGASAVSAEKFSLPFKVEEKATKSVSKPINEDALTNF